jgi:hypothetical protein
VSDSYWGVFIFFVVPCFAILYSPRTTDCSSFNSSNIVFICRIMRPIHSQIEAPRSPAPQSRLGTRRASFAIPVDTFESSSSSVVLGRTTVVDELAPTGQVDCSSASSSVESAIASVASGLSKPGQQSFSTHETREHPTDTTSAAIATLRSDTPGSAPRPGSSASASGVTRKNYKKPNLLEWDREDREAEMALVTSMIDMGKDFQDIARLASTSRDAEAALIR